jgi:acetylornithine deacetylase/succinyl-diaminopimelate desuccinylase-like protein
MPDINERALRLASDLVRIDSRSFVSNMAVADRIEQELTGFEVERLDYVDEAGVTKRALVARRGRAGGLAFSGHMDTVPETGWQEDPWSGHVAGGYLHGLGSVDMKGQTAAAIIAATCLPEAIPVALLLTADEETTKGGALAIAERSQLASGIRSVLVVEPTDMVPMRGHRAHIQFTAVATGVQAHSSTGKGYNANWSLVPFLADMKDLYDRLRSDTSLQDPAYDPVFSDFNLIVDNHGTAVNVNVPKATATIKFRYSASVDPATIVEAVRGSAARNGLELSESREGRPPELPRGHWFVGLCQDATGREAGVAPYGTDASELQAVAPCVLLGPGDIAFAHKPGEKVAVRSLEEAIPVFQRLAEQVARLSE